MAYSEEQKENILNAIFESIENGNSLRKSLIENKISSSTFFIWIDEDELKSKQYARACEIRAEYLFDELLEVAYTTEEGITEKLTDRGVETTKGDMLGHRRLKVDSLKWALSKMFPKKYGDKVDVTSAGEKIQPPSSISVEIVMPKEE